MANVEGTQVGGSGGSYDVKFSYSGVGALSSTIANNLKDMNEAHTQASTAAESAVAAVGGKGNDIGKAVENAITTDTAAQLGEAISIVNNLIDAMSQVKTTYQTQKDEIINAINAAKRNNDESTTVSLGAPTNSTNTVSIN